MNGGVVWHDMACLIVIYDCVGTYNETIIMVSMSTSFLNSLSYPCPSFLRQIITTTQLFQAYMYSWMMLLIVLYDGIVLVRMAWNTDGSVTIITMLLSVLYVGRNE